MPLTPTGPLLPTAPRWKEKVTDFAKPGEEGYMILGYALYGVMVASHSLSFWMSVHKLGTVPTAVAKGAQQAVSRTIVAGIWAAFSSPILSRRHLGCILLSGTVSLLLAGGVPVLAHHLLLRRQVRVHRLQHLRKLYETRRDGGRIATDPGGGDKRGGVHRCWQRLSLPPGAADSRVQRAGYDLEQDAKVGGVCAVLRRLRGLRAQQEQDSRRGRSRRAALNLRGERLCAVIEHTAVTITASFSSPGSGR